MDMYAYKLMHLAGLALVCYGFGGLEAQSDDQGRKRFTISHGIGLLLALVGGFGLAAKTGAGHNEWWIMVKLLVWVALGGAIVIFKRKPELISMTRIALLLLMGTAAYLGIYHHQLG